MSKRLKEKIKFNNIRVHTHIDTIKLPIKIKFIKSIKCVFKADGGKQYDITIFIYYTPKHR